MQPTLGKRAFVPKRLLDDNTVKKAQASLRYKEVTNTRVGAILAEQAYDEKQSEEVNANGPKTVIVNEFRRCRGGVSLPRDWAANNLDLPWVDITVQPQHSINLGRGPTPRDLEQRKFFAKLLIEASIPGPQNILANAATGAGKSVAGIWLGHTLGYRTLIIVDSNKIANGWLNNFRKFYGEAWTEKHVGRIQQDTCEWEDKAFSIALVQSIAARTTRYPLAMYNGFGLVIYDEVQVFGSEGYAPVLGMFSARVRVGFTAENRTGSFGRLIRAHLGKTRVISMQEVLVPRAYLIRNKIEQTFYCMSDGAILTGLARLDDRNNKLAKLIKTRGYDRDRNVLVLSDRTEQLVRLRDMCVRLGVPTADMGLHMGTYISGRHEVVYSYGKNQYSLAVFDTIAESRAVVKLLKRGLPSVELPAGLVRRLSKDAKSVIFSTRKQVYSPDQKELDNITNSCQIVFATYQIFSKGVDVPRLDMGVEGLPSGNLKQPLGRILRLHDGKLEPEWYAICDVVELPELFGNSADSSASLINSYLSGKTKTRINALKRAKAKLTYA